MRLLLLDFQREHPVLRLQRLHLELVSPRLELWVVCYVHTLELIRCLSSLRQELIRDVWRHGLLDLRSLPLAITVELVQRCGLGRRRLVTALHPRRWSEVRGAGEAAADDRIHTRLVLAQMLWQRLEPVLQGNGLPLEAPGFVERPLRFQLEDVRRFLQPDRLLLETAGLLRLHPRLALLGLCDQPK